MVSNQATVNVLIVTQYYPPHVGGLEIVAKRQASSLASAGHSVTVVTCSVQGAPLGRQMENGVTVRRARAINYLDNRFGIPFALPGLKFLRYLVEEIKTADVVELHDVLYPASWLGYLVRLCCRKPLVLMQHVGLVEHSSAFVSAIQRLVYGTIGGAIFRAADRFIVFNPNVKQFLLQRGITAGKISELRNGVDVQKFRPAGTEQLRIRAKFGLSSEKPIVLFVGRLVPKKGFDILIQAADESYETVLAGSGDVPPALRRRNHVTFTGPLTQDQLSELYRVVELFVLPTVGEVFTVAMQEAMASGVPVITTDDPAYESYSLDRRLISLVAPDATAIKTKILALLRDAPQRSAMAHYSRRLAEELFDWDKNAVALDEVLLNAA